MEGKENGDQRTHEQVTPSKQKQKQVKGLQKRKIEAKKQETKKKGNQITSCSTFGN